MSNGERPRPPSLLRNPLSLFGIAVAVLSTAFGLPLMFLDMFSRQANPYLGAVIYLILPLAATAGAGLAILGAAWERHRRAKRPGVAPAPMPRLDLNEPRHQWAVLGVLTGSMVLVILLSITGYRAYHFTESVKFCGLVCHQVMKPEHTAHEYSPHARVACVACHVGSGAEWFVRSKLNGLHQVYALATSTYPKPIPTPVKNLRPAQDTCEQCHSPSKFFGAQQKSFVHRLADETNSPWQIDMLMNVGGGDPKTGAPSGIHWHMNIKNAVYYIASDPQRETIPWVRVVDPAGRVTEYVSTEQPLSPVQLAKAEIRRMDCVDCHNRPAHIFRPPDRAVDEAFEAGRLDPRLPYLKREAVRLLAGEYATEGQAKDAILQGLTAFYQQSYPDVFSEQAGLIRQTAQELQRVYARNMFPEMKADWRAHPDHLGHLNAKGCFRCHDGLHQSREGKIISRDCNACHTILAQGTTAQLTAGAREAQPFQHPVDVGVDVTEMNCSECHTGTSGL